MSVRLLIWAKRKSERAIERVSERKRERKTVLWSSMFYENGLTMLSIRCVLHEFRVHGGCINKSLHKNIIYSIKI